MDINKIHTITELVDMYEKGEIKEEGKTYRVYLSDFHKQKNKIGWIQDSQFKEYLENRKFQKEFEHKLLWGDNFKNQ